MKNIFEKYGRIKHINSLFIILLLIIQHIVYAENNEKWQKIPEANYADVLELIAMRAKANYEEILTWQGCINILSTEHFYGSNAAEKTYAVDINSIARNSKHICGTAKTIAEFAIDLHNDKLYCDYQPTMQYKAIDLDQNVPLSKFTDNPPRTKTVITPEVWMHYDMINKYKTKYNKGKASKMAFIDVSKKSVYNIQDPRNFFDIETDGKLWEVILLTRSALLENGNIQIEGFPYIEITSIETSSGTKYRIQNTFKYGNIIKYIRTLIEVDEAYGFNVIKREEMYPNGVKKHSTKYTYEEFNGIYVPKTYWMESRDINNVVTGTSEITIKTKDINKIIPEDIFTIKNLGLEENAIVTDRIKKKEYRFVESTLVPIENTQK